MTNPRLREAVL